MLSVSKLCLILLYTYQPMQRVSFVYDLTSEMLLLISFNLAFFLCFFSHFFFVLSCFFLSRLRFCLSFYVCAVCVCAIFCGFCYFANLVARHELVCRIRFEWCNGRWGRLEEWEAGGRFYFLCSAFVPSFFFHPSLFVFIVALFFFFFWLALSFCCLCGILW